jgi:ParB/RepB/Spo0J family partition protein
VRKPREEDEEFNANIKSLGVLEPLIVRKRDEDYEVIAGHRRFEAAKKAGIEIIQCQVSDLSDTEAVLVSFSENVARCDLTVTERAIALAQLLGRDKLLENVEEFRSTGITPPLSEPELAEKTGLTVSSISDYLEPLRLQHKTRELLEKGEIPQAVAVQIRQYAETPQDEVEIAEAFAEIDKGKAGSEKRILNKQAGVAFFKEARAQERPKEKIIEELRAMRDSHYEPEPEPASSKVASEEEQEPIIDVPKDVHDPHYEPEPEPASSKVASEEEQEPIIDVPKDVHDPANVEPEEEKAEPPAGWVSIESVTIDECVVTDTSIIARFNRNKVSPAAYAADILTAFLDANGYS